MQCEKLKTFVMHLVVHIVHFASQRAIAYRTILLILKTRNFGYDFKTAEPLLHGQRVDGGVESAIKIIA